jgi:hypothetical protein
MAVHNDTAWLLQTVVIGSPELLAFKEARSSCENDDIEFPFKSYVQFRNAVGYRPSPTCILMRHGNADFSWVELSGEAA